MKKTTAFILILIYAFSNTVLACDLCPCAMANSPFIKAKLEPGFFMGLVEQYVYFGTMQNEGTKIDNSFGQYIHSSNTQAYFGYRFNDRISLQVNIPYIFRAYARPEGNPSVLTTGVEQGIGDITALATARLYKHLFGDWGAFVDVGLGVKFPTGNPHRILEELNELPAGAGIVPSGVHGHDLALGSGSTDVVLGMSLGTSYDWFVATGVLQYAIRNAANIYGVSGMINYRYANDLNWRVSPGAYLWRNRENGLGLFFNMSGEVKGNDQEIKDSDITGAEVANDTSITSLYLGGSVAMLFTNALNVDLSVDVPVIQSNSEIQLLPNVRLRATIGYRF